MSLFSNLAALKKFCGGGINTSLDMRSVEPVIADAAQYHLVGPYLGSALYDALLTAYENNTLSVAQSALLPYVQNALAKLSIHEYTKVGGIELGESGFHRVETDNRKAAFKYQENQFRDYFLEKGYNDLETLLNFLHLNKASYPTWESSEQADNHLSGLLIYAETFRARLQVQCDRWTFECMRPLIRSAEHYMVRKVMPAQLYTQVKAAYIARTMTTYQKELVRLIQVALSSRAMTEAIKQQWITVKSGRVYVVEEFGDSATSNRTTPNQIDNARYWQHEMWAQAYNAEWRQYIYDNKTQFPLAFDTASGGTNTNADAWHIDTATEAEDKEAARADALKRPIFSM